MTPTDHPDVLGPAASRERGIAEAFVTLADSLVSDYDVAEVLDYLVRSCVELLGVHSAGILLDDQAGGLAVMAASDEDMRVLELFQVQHAQGPCRDCVLSGRAVTCTDLQHERARWPEFVEKSLAVGLRAVVAVPLRLHGEVIGALGLFQDSPTALGPDDQRLAQALADVASIGIVQHRSIHRSTMVAEQLRVALDSRVAIEQAKGALAERLQVDMPAAFAHLRKYARDRNLKLAAAAEAILNEGPGTPAGS